MHNDQYARQRDNQNTSEDDDMDDTIEGGANSGLRSRVGRWFAQWNGSAANDDDDEAYEDHPARPMTGGTTFVGTRATSSPSQAPVPSSMPATTAARSTSSTNTFRIASVREGSITVMPVATFADVQKAADRLKAGEPQIVNLEKTDPEIAERLVDFLNGVTYALDGYVERVAEGAYLFTPSHIAIHADGPEAPRTSKTFFDRIS